MEKWFRRSIILMGFMFFLFMMILFSSIFFPTLALIESLGVALICASPLVFLFALVTGLGTLYSRLTNKGEKAKRGFETRMFYDDAMMQQIMSRLSLEERAYLRERLAQVEMGIGQDGELMSFDELMDEKRKR